MGSETIDLKRHPLPGYPRTQFQRYSLLSDQLVRQQQELSKMYSERLLTVRETAQILGGVSAATVRSYCKKGALSTVRIGRYGWIRVKMSSVKQLLEKGMVANV